jgi:hypothetical protein
MMEDRTIDIEVKEELVTDCDFDGKKSAIITVC